MEKTIKIKGFPEPVTIKSISMRRVNAIIKKYKPFLGTFDTVSATEDIIFECLVAPKFATKESMLEYMLPGQYLALSNAIFALIGLKEGAKNENKTD